MCNFSGRLVAWVDGELGQKEAAAVQQHVAACAECTKCVAAYKGASREFAAYYDAATRTSPEPSRRIPVWVPVLTAAAAIVLVTLTLMPRTVTPVPAVAQVAVAALPSVQHETPAAALKRAGKPHCAARRKAQPENWAMVEPAIQIAIPAGAMFPPGAVPEGFTYVANVSLASDGSVQGLHLQP
jgi:anti-sigma factor RsiW